MKSLNQTLNQMGYWPKASHNKPNGNSGIELVSKYLVPQWKAETHTQKLCKFTYKLSCENWYLNSTMWIYNAIQNCASLQVQSKNRQLFAKRFFSNSRPLHLITVMSIWESYKYTAINNGPQFIARDVTLLLTVQIHKMLIQKSNIIPYVILHILRIDHVLPHYERIHIIQGKVTSVAYQWSFNTLPEKLCTFSAKSVICGAS